MLVLAGTVALVPLMKTNFLGSSGQNTFRVTQELPVGTSLDAMDEASQPVEQAIRDTEGVETVQTSIGSGGRGLAAAFGGGGGRRSPTRSRPTRTPIRTRCRPTVRDDLDDLDDVGEVTLAASSGFGASSDIEVDITASNAEDLQAATDAVRRRARRHRLARAGRRRTCRSRGRTSRSRSNRADAAAAGYSEVALGGFVSAAMQPQRAGTVVIDEKTLTIYLATDDPPATVEELSALEVPTPAGARAARHARDRRERRRTGIRHRPCRACAAPPSRRRPRATTSAPRAPRCRGAVDTVDLPAGATASIGGVTADQTESFAQLGLALLAAILIVYIVMVATFRSLLQPLLLLVSVPFAATGAIALQVITGIPLGVASLVGVLMLVGIVVTNAIVLVDLVNQYRDRGMTVRDALVHGASRRLRPILMTALATIFALLPMAIGLTGHGGFISQPLALVVIGGLVSSTALTLVVLPVLYDLVEGGRERRRGAGGEARARTPSAARPRGRRHPSLPSAPSPRRGPPALRPSAPPPR